MQGWKHAGTSVLEVVLTCYVSLGDSQNFMGTILDACEVEQHVSQGSAAFVFCLWFSKSEYLRVAKGNASEQVRKWWSSKNLSALPQDHHSTLAHRWAMWAAASACFLLPYLYVRSKPSGQRGCCALLLQSSISMLQQGAEKLGQH